MTLAEPQADLRLFALRGIPEIAPGADLAAAILGALGDLRFQDGDVLVVAQKIVSKAEGRLLDLATVVPSAFARAAAEPYGRDPRHTETVLRESRRIVKMDRGLMISETHHGFICANAGVDLSNVSGGEVACLLPVDPDASAVRLRAALMERTGATIGVLISDTFGRPWREGVVNVAIGLAGFDPLETYIGKTDPYGYELQTTIIAPADELASAAELVMGKLLQVPVVLVRGYDAQPAGGTARQLVRDAKMDLFR